MQLEIATVGFSVWPDGSVALAIPIENAGNKAAAGVQVFSVSFGYGNRIDPASLPVPLGEILSEQRRVVNARFGSVVTPGDYPLTVSGIYTIAGYSYPFTAHTQVAVSRSTGGTSPTAPVIVPKHSTTGVPTPPSPIPQENDNNPAGPPIPNGPVIKPFSVAPTNTGAAAPAA